MKQISLLLTCAALCFVPAPGHAEDAVTEERLNKLNGLVQDLLEDKVNLRKQMDALAKEVQTLREQASSASTAANAEDLRRLAEKLQEVDRKREADKELILKEIERLGKSIGSSRSRPPASGNSGAGSGNSGGGTSSERGFEYVVQSGDTLSAIAAAYKEQGVKVSVEDILKANPGLKPTSLSVGKKIFIPAPAK